MATVATKTRPGKSFLQAQLAKTELWPAEKLVDHQLGQLDILLDHAARTVPYYRDRLAELSVAQGRPLDIEAWRRIPILTRSDVQTAETRLLSTDVPEAHGRLLQMTSSGSTGRPVRVTGTVADARFFKALVLRNHLWHRHNFAKTFVAIRKRPGFDADYPAGLALHRWGDNATYPFATGSSAMLNITTEFDKQLEWLARQRPGYLFTYPSNLRALASRSQELGIALPGLAQVLTTGEVLDPETRRLCHAAWGVSVADIYSAMEVGTIALQCPEREHYHVQSENIMVEVLDENGRPCAPGEVGRVVVTPLHNFAMPLLRYEIGDFAEVGGACDCGRGLAVLRRVMGRTRGLFVAPDGSRYFPSFGANRFAEIAPVLQHQFVQKAPDLVEARLVVRRPLTPDEEDALRSRILGYLPPASKVDFAYFESIATTADGKYEEYRSEVVAYGSRSATILMPGKPTIPAPATAVSGRAFSMPTI